VAGGGSSGKGALDWLFALVGLPSHFRITGSDKETGLPGEATGSLLGLGAEPLSWTDTHRYIPWDMQMEFGTGPDVRNP
jgi:hypothetical protein